MKAILYEGVGKLRPIDIEKPAPGPGEVLVKVRYCGICGTDIHSFKYEGILFPGTVPGHETVGTIAEIYAEYSCSWTLAGAQTFKRTEDYCYYADAYVLRAKADVHAGVGAFLYKTADGRTVAAYGLSAQAGASFTLAGAAASGDYGSNYLGVLGSASAVVGEVYAKTNVTVGWVGGQFYAVATGAVGADAFRATVSGGIRVLGVEVQGSASFKVGVSAKFEVGFEGSTFKANIGAALGIGVEFSISIDCSKVISVLKDVGKVVVEGAKAVGRFFRRIFRRW